MPKAKTAAQAAASATARRRPDGAPAEGFARERKEPPAQAAASATARRRPDGAAAEGFARERVNPHHCKQGAAPISALHGDRLSQDARGRQ